ncbi:MAG TPA: VWA domain-containing protein [Acidimicrobiales bacterium]|nr:VWA domain-containing protein [Acidimicrobiales bacterium]
MPETGLPEVAPPPGTAPPAGTKPLDGAGPPEAERLAVAFARVLRRAGLSVPVGSTVAFTRALGAVGVDQRQSVYWAGRATLARRPEDFAAYDRAFAAFWLGREGVRVPVPNVEEVVLEAAEEDEDGGEGEGERDEEGREMRVVRYSPVELLRHKDFAACSPEELAEMRRLMGDLRLEGALRRSRRLTPSRRPRGAPDPRRTIRQALRAGGEPVRRAHLEPSWRPRRVVLLCDVSGSMEPYARSLLRFLHVAVVGGARIEAFAVGTRLTRLTRQLSQRDPDAALADAAAQVSDWSGGTRLGEGIREFNERFGVRGMARGAVVVVLSDGWDRGDPEVLAEAMRRLRAVAHRVVWVNPLKASPGYAPLARGMAAALPYVDEFMEGHSLASLERLAEVIRR